MNRYSGLLAARGAQGIYPQFFPPGSIRPRLRQHAEVHGERLRPEVLPHLETRVVTRRSLPSRRTAPAPTTA